jgi:uncharacterized membrane protein YccC
MPLGLTVHPTVPDIGAVVRSLLGVLVVAAVAVQWGSAGAATAAAGAAAIAGATALQDSPRGPTRLVVGVSIAMGAAVLLGALTAAYPVPLVLAAAAWSFGAGMLWAISANAGLIAVAAAALLVASPPMPPTLSTVLGATALAVAGGLAQAVLIAVWPRRRWRLQRDALVDAYRSLSADARRLAEEGSGQVNATPLIDLREAFTLTDQQARRRPPAYRGWYGLPERIAMTLTALSGRSPGTPVRELLTAAAGALDAIASNSRQDATAALDKVGIAVAATPHSDIIVANRLSAQLSEAAALRFDDWSPDAEHVTELRRPDLRVAARALVEVLRGHVDRTSPIFRHAIRLGVAVGIGVALASILAMPHGYWIALTVLMVMRPETAHTYTRCAGRLAGNAAGIIAASVVVMVWHPTGIAAAVLAIACLGLAYVASGVGYVALSASLAAAIVFVIDISGAVGAATLTDRLVATVVGGGLAVVAHVALPDDALVRLRQRAGELLRTETDYAATVIKAFAQGADEPTDELSAAWQRAFRARAAFEAASGATRVTARDLRLWLQSYRAALNAVTAACTTLESSLPGFSSTPLTTEFTSAIDDYVTVLCGTTPDPATPWTVDAAELTAAGQRVRDTASTLATSTAATRLLVAEISAITRNLAIIADGAPAAD